MLTPLEIIKVAYNEALILSDDDQLAIDYFIASIAGNMHPYITEPLWIYFIGPPSTGKTEISRAVDSHENFVAISSLTDNALISGYEREDGGDPSLILFLDGKILVIKDMTALLNSHPTTAKKIFGDFRDAYDGSCSKASGRAGLRTYHSRFGIIACVTPFIDAFNAENQTLGERFLSCRLCRCYTSPTEELALLLKVSKTAKNKEAWRAVLRNKVQTQLGGIKTHIANHEPPTIAEADVKKVASLAYLLSKLRTTAIRSVSVDSESGARVLQQLIALGQGHAIADLRTEWNDSDTILVRRAVIDTLSLHQRRLLISLYGGRDVRPLLDSTQLARLTSSLSPSVDSIMTQYTYSGVLHKTSTSIAGQKEDYNRYSLAPSVRDFIEDTGLLVPGPHLPKFARKGDKE